MEFLKTIVINLFTTHYPESRACRAAELMAAIKNNIALDSINKIFLLNEGGDLSALSSPKIVEIKINQRPRYNDFFRIINEHSSDNDINIIANTDIYFDETISVLKYLGLTGKCLALSRWDIQPDGSAKLCDRNDTQDVWVFKGKIKEVKGNFLVGVPRCDNRILYELQNSGYKVLNPAYSIRSYHLHAGVRGEYDNSSPDCVEPPYRYLYPHNCFSLLGTMFFNLTHKEKLCRYRYDLKRMNKWLIFKIYRRIYKLITRNTPPLIGYK